MNPVCMCVGYMVSEHACGSSHERVGDNEEVVWEEGREEGRTKYKNNKWAGKGGRAFLVLPPTSSLSIYSP